MPRRRSPSGESKGRPFEGSSTSREDPSTSAAESSLPQAEGPPRITLAAIIGAHGVRGEVRLKPFTDSLSHHELVFVNGTPRRLLHVGGTPKSPTARLEGLADRSAAEALRGTLIEVDRDALPPLDDGEYYHVDLIGLACVDEGGAEIGTVAAVENFGAGDLLDIELPNGKRSLIPFRPGVADLQDGRILLDPAFLA